MHESVDPGNASNGNSLIEKFSTWKDVLVVAAFLVSLTQRPCTEKNAVHSDAYFSSISRVYNKKKYAF